MITKNKGLLILGAAAAAVLALAAGVDLGTLLLVGAVLLCPAAMYFGMQGMQQGGCGHGSQCKHSKAGGAEREAVNQEREKVA